MREYELMIIAKAELNEAELTKLYEKCENTIAPKGGAVIKKELWGIRRLAYPILKHNRGNYILYDIATEAENIIELERLLKLDDKVLRAMVIKLADSVDIEKRKIELKKQAEAAALQAAESAREKAETESFQARRGPQREDE